MPCLEDKKILYIGPKFFGYEMAIQATLEKKFGAAVDFYDDRPSNDFWTKTFIRLNLKSIFKKKISNYYHTIVTKIKTKSYDYVFIISPETLGFKELETIKTIQKSATFILYMWDSFDNKNSLNTLHLFDRIITFDQKDAKKYDLFFYPLFYIENYKSVPVNSVNKYDLCLIATAHSDRYSLSKTIKKRLENSSLTMFSFFYLNNKLMYWGRRIFLKKYQYGSINDFSFSPLSQDQVTTLMSQSKTILDINHPAQIGLTMRTFEVLGAHKKLITTNENIKTYDFYNETNILVIDRHNPIINIDFFKTPYQLLEKSTYQKYSLESWISYVFNCQ
jgi:hypothetical protein